MSDIEVSTTDATASPFDSIKLPNDRWSARDLMPMLGYDEWRNFERCVNEARKAAEITGASDQFVDTNKMIEAGKGARREVSDVEMTRYGAYMVAMSCDGRKPEVAQAKTYFAVKTREAETRPAFDANSLSRMDILQLAVAAEKDLQVEREHTKMLTARIDRDAPLVAKAEAHTASDNSAVNRQTFAREVQAWGVKQNVTITHEQVYEMLRRKGMLVDGERGDRNHATSHAVKSGWAWTHKGTTDNGRAFHTTYLYARGQDIAWKWITAYVKEHGHLRMPFRIGGAA